MALVNVVDLNSDGAATVQHYDVADTVRPWFPDAPTDIDGAITSLQTALNAANYEQVDALCVTLGLSIQVVGAPVSS